MFLLRGQDRLAAQVVRYYARLLNLEKNDPEMVEACFSWADEMDKWPTKKMPDL